MFILYTPFAALVVLALGAVNLPHIFAHNAAAYVAKACYLSRSLFGVFAHVCGMFWVCLFWAPPPNVLALRTCPFLLLPVLLRALGCLLEAWLCDSLARFVRRHGQVLCGPDALGVWVALAAPRAFRC